MMDNKEEEVKEAEVKSDTKPVDDICGDDEDKVKDEKEDIATPTTPDEIVKDLKSQLDTVWDRLSKRTFALHEDKLTSLEIQKFLETIESEHNTAEDAAKLCMVINLMASQHSKEKGEEEEGEIDQEFVSKSNFMKVIMADEFKRSEWPLAVKHMFNKFASKGSRQDAITAKAFLEMCREYGEKTDEEDIKDLFNEVLGYKDGEVAFVDMAMDMETFRNLLLSDLEGYLDNDEVKTKLLGHLLPSPSGDHYKVRYDEASMRYVSDK